MRMRRSTYRDAAVTYGAVGATQTDDVIKYPPKGFRAIERSVRLGSGEERFRTASETIMTWGAHRASGVDVTAVVGERGEDEVSEEAPNFSPLSPNGEEETVFAADGTPYLTQGMTVILDAAWGPFRRSVPVRVIYVVDEPQRTGFAYGTLEGHLLSGEEAFFVDKREDGSVWFTIRTFTRLTMRFERFVAPFFRVVQLRYIDRYLHAIAPGRA